MRQDNSKLHSGLVWIFSGCLLLVYGLLGLFNTNVPGVEEIVSFISSVNGPYLYLGAFLTIFIEGLYIIGSFFPGSSLIVIIAVLAQVGGILQFLGVIFAIYIGWLLAGLVNVVIARYFYRSLHLDKLPPKKISNYTSISWFPAFRANTEVAQIAEGHKIFKVILSSFKIKTYASLGMTLCVLILPFIINIKDLNNKEGFWSLGIIALINFIVGGYKIYNHRRKQKTAD